MAKNKIKVGIWGLGRAGWGMHIDEIARYSDEFEIVAGCDIDAGRPEKLAERIPGAKAYSDAEAFLKDENIELFVVAVRSAQHVDYAIRALETVGLQITMIKDVTPVPHNGCRPPKRRRV